MFNGSLQKIDEQNASQVNSKVRRKKNLSNSILELIATAKRVEPHWRASGAPIIWVKPVDLNNEISVLENSEVLKAYEYTSKKTLSIQLTDIRNNTKEPSATIKSILRTKFGFEMSKGIYPECGYEHKGNSYVFPTDREKFLKSLNMMVAVCEKYGFEGMVHGTEHWIAQRDLYQSILEQSGVKTGKVSQGSKEKINSKLKIQRILKSILKMIEMNYPDDHVKVKREWGFYKENN